MRVCVSAWRGRDYVSVCVYECVREGVCTASVCMFVSVPDRVYLYVHVRACVCYLHLCV